MIGLASTIEATQKISLKHNMNELVDQINDPSFYYSLVAGEPEAWHVILQYTQKRVAQITRNRPLLPNQTRTQFIEERSAEACEVIITKLAEFKGNGLLSAYINRLIQRGIADRVFKNLMEAVAHFLQSVPKLPSAQQVMLRQIIDDIPTFTRKERHQFASMFEQTAVSERLPDYATRNKLLKVSAFQTFLYTVRSYSRQADTVLMWLHKDKDRFWIAATDSDDTEDELDRIEDTANTPLEELMQRDNQRLLLTCLAELKQKSPRQYEAITYKFYQSLRYNEIVQLMGAQKNTVQQWVSRGLSNLSKCVTMKVGS